MGIFAFRGTHPIRAIHTADGGTGMPAATKRLRGLGMPKTVPTQQPYGHGGAIGRTVRITRTRTTDAAAEDA